MQLHVQVKQVLHTKCKPTAHKRQEGVPFDECGRTSAVHARSPIDWRGHHMTFGNDFCTVRFTASNWKTLWSSSESQQENKKCIFRPGFTRNLLLRRKKRPKSTSKSRRIWIPGFPSYNIGYDFVILFHRSYLDSCWEYAFENDWTQVLSAS